MKKSPIKIFSYGTIAAVLIIAVTLLFMNPPQCPSDGSQSGITNCVTGANIGLGINVLLAVGIWLITIIISLIRYAQITLARTDEKKAMLATLTILVVLASALAAYTIIWVFMRSLSSLVNS